MGDPFVLVSDPPIDTLVPVAHLLGLGHRLRSLGLGHRLPHMRDKQALVPHGWACTIVNTLPQLNSLTWLLASPCSLCTSGTMQSAICHCPVVNVLLQPPTLAQDGDRYTENPWQRILAHHCISLGAGMTLAPIIVMAGPTSLLATAGLTTSISMGMLAYRYWLWLQPPDPVVLHGAGPAHFQANGSVLSSTGWFAKMGGPVQRPPCPLVVLNHVRIRAVATFIWARGIQCCTESMSHTFSEHSNGAL